MAEVIRQAGQKMFVIEGPSFMAGFLVQGRHICDAAPSIRYMIGWNGHEVADYCRRKGWSLREVTPINGG